MQYFSLLPLKLGMQPHPVAKFFWQNWLDLGEIWANFGKK